MAEGRSRGLPSPRDPVSLLFRFTLDERRRVLFPRGGRVLEIRPGGWSGPEPDGGFDAAFGPPGALDGAEPERLGTWVARALRPRAPVVLCLPGPRPLPDLLARALTAAPGTASPNARALREWRARLGPDFAWRRTFALGVLLPGPGRSAWAGERPLLLGLAAAAERVLRGLPPFRGLGALAVLEGVRR